MDSLTALEARFPGGRETDPGHPRNPANAWTRGALNRFANPRYHVFQKAGKIEVGPVVPDAQQLREAFPWDESPRYLIRDRDHTFDGLGATAKAMGMHEVLTAPRSPCKTHLRNGLLDRSVETASITVIVFHEAGLERFLKLYCDYHQRSRTHPSLDKDTPIPRPVTASVGEPIVAVPQVGGLHHRYERDAA